MAEQRRDKQDTGCTVELHVVGMSCQGCEQALSLLLRQHPAVRSVEADAQSGTVRVQLDEQVDTAELKDRIRSLGYDVP